LTRTDHSDREDDVEDCVVKTKYTRYLVRASNFDHYIFQIFTVEATITRVMPKVYVLYMLGNNIFHNLYISETRIFY